MRVRTSTSAVAALCTVCVAAVSVTPTANAAAVNTAPAVPQQRAYLLAAATAPITYLTNVVDAFTDVQTEVTALQTDLPLLIFTAETDPDTGDYLAVQQVQSTTTSVQTLVSAIADLPGASAQGIIDQIGAAGDALATATNSIVVATAPYTAPFAYAAKVVYYGEQAYLAVVGLPDHLYDALLTGDDPSTVIDDMVASFDDLKNVISQGIPTTASVTTTAGDTVTTLAAARTDTAETDTVETDTVEGAVETAASKSADTDVPTTRSSAAAAAKTLSSAGLDFSSRLESAAKKFTDRVTGHPFSGLSSHAHAVATDDAGSDVTKPADAPKKRTLGSHLKSSTGSGDSAGSETKTPRDAGPKHAKSDRHEAKKDRGGDE